MQKRVLIFSHEYPPMPGGAGTAINDIAHQLVNNGVKVTILTNEVEDRKPLANIQLIQVDTLPKIRFISYWKALKKLDLERFDAIIINDIGAALTASLKFPEKILKKCIVYLHGSEPEHIFKKPGLLFRILGFKKKYCNILKQCKKIVAVSHYMKEKFLSVTGFTEIADKINVIYVGIDLRLFKPQEFDVYRAHHIDSHKKILLTVGRLVKGKGYMTKLKIFENLNTKKSEYHWIIIGSGGYEEEFKSEIKKRGLIDTVTIITNLSRNELARYYSSATYFWLLSDFEESLGLVYLEAQFCGTPAIGYNRAGVKETIIHEKTGFLINSEDECLDILQNNEQLKVDQESINALKETFNIRKNINLLLNLL